MKLNVKIVNAYNLICDVNKKHDNYYIITVNEW
jgi:hypothetical protein